MKRYFVIFYTCSRTDTNGYTIGWCTFVSQDGRYVNKKEIENFVKSWKGNENIKDIVITNILELSESDFQDFIKEE